MKSYQNGNYNNILFFHKADDYTGSTRALATVIGSQKATVITISPSGNGFLSDMDNVKLVPVLYPKIHGREIPVFTFLISYVYRILRAIQFANNVDIFYINTISPFYAAIIGWLFRKKIIYHIHEKIINPGIIYRIAEFVFNHSSSKTIYVSNYLRSCYPQKKGPSEIIYNTLPDEFIDKTIVRSIESRQRNKIIMISSLSKEKGVDVFVEIAKKMPSYNFSLVLSTDASTINSYFQSIPDNLTIFPKQKELNHFYYDADLLLNLTQPSVCIETFGLTILEAMIYGIPAIVPNAGGPMELVVDGFNGFCVNVEDSDEIVRSIQRAFEPNIYKKLASNSLIRYNTIFSHESNHTTVSL